MKETRRGPRGGAGQVAFTVVELLIAVAITAALAALMFSLSSNVLGAWNRMHGTLVTESQARLALNTLAEDLQAAFYRNDGTVWLAATIQNDVGTSGRWDTLTENVNAKTAAPVADAALPDFTESHFGLAGVWLRFFTTVRPTSAGDTAIAGPGAVSYQIIRRRSTTAAAAEPHYLLYRAEVTAANSFAAGFNLDPVSGGYVSASDTGGVAGNIIRPPIDRVLADNVIDFGVRFYARDASGAWAVIFPTSGGPAEYLARSPATALTAADRFPEMADVSLRVLSPEGVRLIRALESGQTQGDWWTVALAHSRLFTRRVKLTGGAF